ncbi:MAG: BolA family transcriptional regulator [Epsilonproteobacteria bacterium]|nr:MAG: BolA family transcriptional regulator [Campylobacterota bacterium]RLA64861.1 MAG: BolA family transcriptional regulator [Campylobacterota bacterium]
MEFENVKSLIKNKIPDADVTVIDLTGTKDHLGLEIVSNEFTGKRLIQQHQMIMDILKEELNQNIIHAVQIKTMTKEQKEKQNGKESL